MMVMCSNHSSYHFLHLCQKHYGRLGWLMGPSSYRKPKAEVPFALDNDCYIHFKNGTRFDAAEWERFISKVSRSPLPPRFAIVPDVVADREATLRSWEQYFPVVRGSGFPTAFAVQDGMTPNDVPENADIVFVGGTTTWKWRNLEMWTSNFPRVHVGRAGTSRHKLEWLEELGVESCDGSGWFRATINGREARQLRGYLERDSKPQDFWPRHLATSGHT